MEQIENQLLELTRAVFRLHSLDRPVSNVPVSLENQGFRNVSLNFVQAIFDKLANEANKYMNVCFSNAKKALHYTLKVEETYISRNVYFWTERYFLSHMHNLPGEFYTIEVFDTLLCLFIPFKRDYDRKDWKNY
jgi:hypothetical protein